MPLILVAGGTGIAPFASYLATRLGLSVAFPPVTLFYGIAVPEHIGFEARLRRAAAHFLDLRLFVESGAYESARAGRIALEELLEVAHLEPTAEIYVAGPPTMTATISKALASAEISEDRVHFDQWE
jgi:ferredoxin-NADP reductase